MSRMRPLSVGALLVAVATAQTPALRKGVSVQMPVTTNAVAMPDADLADSLVVAVTSRGAVFLDVTTVTPTQLSEKVKAALDGHPGKRLYVKGDARTPYSTVADVLSALRTAGVNAPILLTAQREPTHTSYAPPKGLEVLVTPPAPVPPYITLKVGDGQPSDTQLKQQAQRGGPVLLQVDGKALFGDVVHVVDICREAGAKVFLSANIR